MSRITKPIEERRQEIINTAKKLFVKKGFDKTQMADISKKMNVAAGTVYHYFKSKTDLLYAVIDELTDENTQKKHQLLSNAQSSAIDRLKLLFSSFENGEFQHHLSVKFTDDPAIIQYQLTKMVNSYMPLLLSLIEQGNSDGSWKCEYPNETAIFLLQGMFGVMSREHSLKDSPKEKNKKIATYKNMIYRVLGVVELE